MKFGGSVEYEVDATDIKIPGKFDVIWWNFPHISGKMNIKRNRELLFNFLTSARTKLNTDGQIKVSLCDGQCGTSVTSRIGWDRSWKLSYQASEAGLQLIDQEDFILNQYSGYQPQGHRGFGGSFRTGLNPKIFTLCEPKPKIKSFQAPLYSHEVHLLHTELVTDLTGLERKAFEYLSNTLSDVIKDIKSVEKNSVLDFDSVVWAVNIVDLYRCPGTGLMSHAIQIAYCCIDYPLNRRIADKFREISEKKLPTFLDMIPREEKHGKQISKPYGWYVAEKLKKVELDFNAINLSNLNEETDVLQELRILEDKERVNDKLTQQKPTNKIIRNTMIGIKEPVYRIIARRLWQRRVSVLSKGDES